MKNKYFFSIALLSFMSVQAVFCQSWITHAPNEKLDQLNASLYKKNKVSQLEVVVKTEATNIPESLALPFATKKVSIAKDGKTNTESLTFTNGTVEHTQFEYQGEKLIKKTLLDAKKKEVERTEYTYAMNGLIESESIYYQDVLEKVFIYKLENNQLNVYVGASRNDATRMTASAILDQNNRPTEVNYLQYASDGQAKTSLTVTHQYDKDGFLVRTHNQYAHSAGQNDLALDPTGTKYFYDANIHKLLSMVRYTQKGEDTKTNLKYTYTFKAGATDLVDKIIVDSEKFQFFYQHTYKF